MKVYDESNYLELVNGEGRGRERVAGIEYDYVMHDGHKRYLSRMETESGRKFMASLPPFRDVFPVFSRDEVFDRVKAQEKKPGESGKLISLEEYDAMYKIKAHDQDGLPTCWANGPAASFTLIRCIMGLPLVYISACSFAVPISGGHSGGDEADAGDYCQKHGGASQLVWPNNDTDRSLNNDPKVIADRLHHMAYQLYSLTGSQAERQMQMATAYTMDVPMPVAGAYNWWSHVIRGGRIKRGSGTSMINRQRNNWGDAWGEKNEFDPSIGGGYVEMAEGHGTFDSGFAVGFMTASAA